MRRGRRRAGARPIPLRRAATGRLCRTWGSGRRDHPFAQVVGQGSAFAEPAHPGGHQVQDLGGDLVGDPVADELELELDAARRHREPRLGKRALHPLLGQRGDRLGIRLGCPGGRAPLGERTGHHGDVEVPVQVRGHGRRPASLAHAVVEFADPALGPEPVVDHRSWFVTTDAALICRVELDQAQQLIGIGDGFRLGRLCRVADRVPPRRRGLLHVVEDPDVGQDDEPGGVDVEQQHVLTGAARISETGDHRVPGAVGVAHPPDLTRRGDAGRVEQPGRRRGVGAQRLHEPTAGQRRDQRGWRDRGEAVQQPVGRPPLAAADRPVETVAGGVGQFGKPPVEPQTLPGVVDRPVQLRPDQLRGELLELARAGRGDQRGGAVEDPADGVVEPGGPFLRAEGALEHGERRLRPYGGLPCRPHRGGARCALGGLLRFATTRYRRHPRDRSDQLHGRGRYPAGQTPTRLDGGRRGDRPRAVLRTRNEITNPTLVVQLAFCSARRPGLTHLWRYSSGRGR